MKKKMKSLSSVPLSLESEKQRLRSWAQPVAEMSFEQLREEFNNVLNKTSKLSAMSRKFVIQKYLHDLNERERINMEKEHKEIELKIQEEKFEELTKQHE
jgi:hypothetical protein